jgi:hypothetical protein
MHGSSAFGYMSDFITPLYLFLLYINNNFSSFCGLFYSAVSFGGYLASNGRQTGKR